MNYLIIKLRYRKEKKQAFTLIEVMVAMFVFVSVIAGSTVIFASIFKAYQTSKHLQQNMENAQYAIALMSKTFRTSSVVNVTGDKASVTVFDYSNSECVKYSFIGGSLIKSISSVGDLTDCVTTTFGSSAVMTSGNVTGKFYASKSAPKGSPGAKVGMITISMTITSGNKKINIQTSSSLRDYGVSEITL